MMMIDHAKGKVNLTLDILGKRPDSYHELDMILQSVELSDTIVFETTESGDPVSLVLTDGCEGIPAGDDNLIIKAAKALHPLASDPKPVRIALEKNIPSGAGLGGGSADAACTLRVLRGIWDCDISDSELLVLASKVGADVPFLINGGCCECTGIGEKLDPIPGLEDVFLAVIKPGISLSTARIYGLFDEMKLPGRSDTKACREALERNDTKEASKLLGNALEEAAISLSPAIKQIKEMLLEDGALGSSMTGSGSAVYGIFYDKRKAFAAARRISEEFKDLEIKTFLTAPASV
ncbi:MAG: 4-(cytidine 5'-diphospho)-2-C-methyl-D-erythritol kinase [Lachnospiraceae bacterium]|nr:4-(cytidine 5'-diphospho)-2-C-methyl-D-erythritol kinase [Lachnospiraceae bacterium]